MQSSSSFSNSRTGKSRPSNILSSRPEPSESLPWPSPSFNVSAQDGLGVSADPDRPSTQIKISPTGRLPPTPLTATYKPTLLPDVEMKSSNMLKLPSVSNLLAHTPPNSNETRTVPLPIIDDRYTPMEVDAPIRTGYSPPEAPTSISMPKSTSKSGIFQGSSSEWTGNNASFAQMERRPFAPRPDLTRRQSVPVSVQSFRNMPSSNEVQGLGLDLGEETPRLGDSGNWSMMTPTMSSQQQVPGIPGAPQMSSMQTGRFPTAQPSSPIKPPLRNWNTDLRFENRQFAPKPFGIRSFSDTPTSIAMERERTVEIEGLMPMQSRNWGLAISTDDGQTYRRGSLLHRGDGSVIGPAPPQVLQLAGPPTPTGGSFNFASTSTSSASKGKIPSPTAPSSVSKRPLNSTGLTPHIHKTRLTPAVSSSSKGKGKQSGSGDTLEVESPSLKMKSKQRSEQLREQAEFIALQGHLPADLPMPLPTMTSSSSPTSPTRDEDFAVVQEVHSRTAPPSVSPRYKRGLAVRKGDSNSQASKMESSPWGVFGINTINDAWQPLGPPALSKVLGKLELTDNKSSAMEGKEAKKPRKGSLVEQSSFRKERSGSIVKLHRYGSEDKENDVFGSSATVGKRTPTSSVPPSPTKSAFGQRRLVNIR